MQTSLMGIAEKARKQKKHRFQNLYSLLNEELLRDSWKKLNRRAAPGIDEVTWHEYRKNLDENISKLVEKLKEKRYRAKLVRRKYIPKGQGELRPLGIPVLEDKLVQHAATQILRMIYEEDFLASSYGYRQNTGAHDAVKRLQVELRFGGYKHVVDADIKGFFDNMDHKWMMRMLAERIDDKAYLGLIRKWLKAGILEEGKGVTRPVTGTPQGGVISPVLANVYMHYVLNLWFEKIVKKHIVGKAELWVYADDFVAAFENSEDTRRFYNVLGKRLGKFGLQLAYEKTRVVQFRPINGSEQGEAFDFLGFEFRWMKSRKGKYWVRRGTSKKKQRTSLKNFNQWCKKNRDIGNRVLFRKLNARLRGYYNYYGLIGNYDDLNTFSYRVERILFKWLNRRSQRRSYTWKGFYAMLRYYRVPRPRLIH